MVRPAFWTVSAAIGAALLAAGVQPAMAQKKLIYSTYLPSSHGVIAGAVAPYLDRVKKDTQGSLSFEMSTDGALTSAKETLAAFRTKAIDAGFIVDIYTPANLPESTMISDLALLGSDPWAGTAAMNETLLITCPECRARFQKSNVWPIAYISTSAYYPLCTSEIKSAQDLKGKKIRATTSWAVWAGASGAVAVNIPSSEIYEALSRGQADCSVSVLSHLQHFSLWDVVKYVTDMPIGTYTGGLFFNVRADLWKDLSTAEKKALIDNAPQAIIDGIESYVDADEKAKAASIQKGIKFVEPSDDLKAIYEALKPAEIKRIAAQGKKMGLVADPDKLLAMFEANLKKWEKIVQETKADRKAYAEALQREIYSKIPTN